MTSKQRPVPAPRLSKLVASTSSTTSMPDANLIQYDHSPRRPAPTRPPPPPPRIQPTDHNIANSSSIALTTHSLPPSIPSRRDDFRQSQQSCSSAESPLSVGSSIKSGPDGGQTPMEYSVTDDIHVEYQKDMDISRSIDNMSDESAFVSGQQSADDDDNDDPPPCSSTDRRALSVENPEYLHLSVFRSLAGIAPPSMVSVDVLNDFDPLHSPRPTDSTVTTSAQSHSPSSIKTFSANTAANKNTTDLIKSFLETNLDMRSPSSRPGTSSSTTDSQTHDSDLANNNFDADNTTFDDLDHSGDSENVDDFVDGSRTVNVMSIADTISVNTQFGCNDFRESKLMLKTEDLRNSLIPIGQSVCYCGWTTIQRGNAQGNRAQRLWSTLKQGTLQFYIDDNSTDASCVLSVLCSDVVLLAPSLPPLPNTHLSALSLRKSSFNSSSSSISQSINTPSISNSSSANIDLCANTFSIAYRTYTNKGQQLINLLRIGVDEQLEMSNWMLLLAKVCAPHESIANMIDTVQLAGHFYAKQGVAGEWHKAWGFLNGKTLSYCFENDVDCLQVDLRKVIRLTPEVSNRSEWHPSCSQTCVVAPFLLSRYGTSLCLQSEFDIVTNAWRLHIEKELNRVSTKLDEQRLTADDVLLLVDKCIKFISMQGLQEEGIYRKPGSRAHVTKMLLDLTKDPHDYVIQLDCDGTVHSAATAYRRYIREYIDEPLFPKDLQQRFFAAASVTNDFDSKIELYKQAVFELPPINHSTLRKIFSHLKECTDQCGSNRATVDNVAVVFGPTLMTVQNDTEDSFEDASSSGHHGLKRQVVHDMITNFNTVFDVSDEEIKQNVKLASQVDQMHQAIDGALSKKPAGSFLVSVHVLEKDNRPFNIQSEKTAGEVVEFGVDHCGLEPLGRNYKLYECVRDGQLKRLVFPDERLTDIVVCRWYNWKEEDRGQSYLLIDEDIWMQRLSDLDLDPFANEVKFADRGQKSWKKCACRYSQGRVEMLKDMKAKSAFKMFNANNLLWWFGCEKKRDAPYKHTLTFVDKSDIPNPSKFFGCSMSFKNSMDMLRWAATVLSIK